jgi:hypothetical protein
MIRPDQPAKPLPLRIVARVWRFLRKRVRKWRERHQHPFNFAIHLIGIPLALAGIVILFYDPWYCGVGTILLGYLLQIIGHWVEGNDVGEWYFIKKLLGLPGVAIAPVRGQPAGDR